MSVYCAWASIDENSKTKGGTAGDQTGKEVKTGLLYNFGQTRVYRCIDKAKAALIGSAAKNMADNCNIGYDQGERGSLYALLSQNGWDISRVTTPVETDCSNLGACAVNIAYQKSLIPSSVYSGNIGSALLSTGLFTELKDTKYMGKSEYIQCGDLIVKPGSHVIIAYTNGSKNSILMSGQKHAVAFTGVSIAIDGIAGPATTKMKSRVLQHALNMDYHTNLVEDGIFGTLSKRALGTHYVKKGETQYLVTAAEILAELNGVNPNGVEIPGTYGNGLVSASKTLLKDDGRTITSSDFLKLI